MGGFFIANLPLGRCPRPERCTPPGSAAGACAADSDSASPAQSLGKKEKKQHVDLREGNPVVQIQIQTDIQSKSITLQFHTR